MESHVEFRSSAFPPYDGEEAAINPGRWGKRLAEFLAAGLQGRGFVIRDLIAEDWGWVIPIENPSFPLWIGCGNYDEYPDDGFFCFIEPHKPTIRRWFRKVDTIEQVTALRAAMNKVLGAEPSTRGLRWWTYEDVNNP
jgi:hypothetical protein